MVKFGAQYHAIDPQFENGEAGMSVNDAPYYGGFKSGMPYGADDKGYGVAAATNLGPVALDAYYDSYIDYAGEGDRTNSFGVAGGMKFRALKAVAFYNGTQTGGTSTYRNTTTLIPVGITYMDVAALPYMYSSSYGGVLTHDGKAKDALVKDLNFTVADAYFYGLKANDLQVFGSYSGTFGGVTVAPFARYHMLTVPGDKLTTTSDSDVYSYSTIKYGVKASTQPFTEIPLQPSAFVNFAQRQTTVKGNSNVAGETLVQTGVSFNRFLANNLKTSIGYAYYKGSNVNRIDLGTSASGASATYSAAADRIYASPNSYNMFAGDNVGAANGSLNGIFAQMDWNGLQANYGIFQYTDNVYNTAAGTKLGQNVSGKPTSVAQGFKVSYTFKF